VLILLLLPSISIAQVEVKREMEKSIPVKEFPSKCLHRIKPFFIKSKKIRYYKEQNGERLTYEIKLKKEGKQYSIEFHQDCKLIDIEELVKLKELDKKIQNQIIDFFKKHYKKYKMYRIQKQYSPRKEDTDSFFVNNFFIETNKPYELRYEIEAEVITKDRKEVLRFEYLFDNQGNLIQKRKIEKGLMDNVLY
jgi:hypothetical protein